MPDAQLPWTHHGPRCTVSIISFVSALCIIGSKRRLATRMLSSHRRSVSMWEWSNRLYGCGHGFFLSEYTVCESSQAQLLPCVTSATATTFTHATATFITAPATRKITIVMSQRLTPDFRAVA